MQVIGHLGKDAYVKEVNGKKVVNFSVAHTAKYKNKAGVMVVNTTWVEVGYWDDKAALVPYLKTGTMVHVQGEPSSNAFVGKEGDVKSVLRLNARSIKLLSASNPDNKKSEKNNEKTGTTGTTNAVPPPSTDPLDDLPF